MDKFGIFNLLNSFFPLNAQKEQPSTNKTEPSTNLLSNLFSSLSNTENQVGASVKTQANSSGKTSAPLNVPHPLQEKMLLTVANHDAIVKRVKQNKKDF